MNIVHSGDNYQIYGENIKTYRELPAGSYNVNFHKMMGFYLTQRHDLVVTEDKIYGNSPLKVEKVMKSYGTTTRNFGVLLSGQKGIGKSLFVRLLAVAAEKIGMPVIVVDCAYPGLANFISSIEQNCMVIFDEFEKTFSKQDDWNPQDDMLSLFDGIDGGHKLFVVTCNELDKLSPYMLNRPGRFHYHFTMSAPTPDEVREYMLDKVDHKFMSEINDIVTLSGTIDMPYDFLRAIAFELNQGYGLKETMNDLNITRIDRMKFDITIYLKDGTRYESWGEKLDLASHEMHWCRARNYDSKKDFTFQFIPSLAHMVGGEYIVNEKIISPRWDEDDFYELPEDKRQAAADAMNANPIERIVLKKVPDYSPARYLV